MRGTEAGTVANFFIPFCWSLEEAEAEYASFVERSSHPLADPSARLCRIALAHGERQVIAGVGADLIGWLHPLGSVVAILETIQVVYVYVRPKGTSVTTPVLFNPAQ